jgi:hypothetical protein
MLGAERDARLIAASIRLAILTVSSGPLGGVEARMTL